MDKKILLKLTLVILACSFSFAGRASLLTDEFSLKDQDNQEVKLSKFKTKIIALTMFYTECKKTCPMLTLKALKEIESYYQNQAKPIDVVLVTFDPESDTPEALLKYKTKMNLGANWHFLVGSLEDTKKIASNLGMGDYWKMDEHILHGFKILILNPLGEVETTLDWKHPTLDAALKAKNL